MTPAARVARTPLVILGLVAALVVAALAVVLTRSTSMQLPASQPDGIVQRYAAAVLAGDAPTALRYLSPQIRAACPEPAAAVSSDTSVRLSATSLRGATAVVNVFVVTGAGGGPLGTPESEADEVFRLVQGAQGWRITSAPWQLTICPEAGAEVEP